jgi:CheY-like chemotaxis protein
MTVKPRIVVLDDDEIFAALISASMEAECDVAVGRNGLEGITLCLEAHTDLLVTDVGMPELDGIQMLVEFQKDPRLNSIPVVVVTATHFSRQNRSDLTRYPQVRDIIHKSSPLDSISLEIQKALKESLNSGPKPK